MSLREFENRHAKTEVAFRKYMQSKSEVMRELNESLHLFVQEKSCFKARTILQDIAQQVQQAAHGRVAEIVTTALRTVFGDEYEFQINFTMNRNKTEAEPVIVKNGQELSPLAATGGGVVDVAAFALRIACISLTRPHIRPLIVLDEPFKFVSEEFRPLVAELIEVLAEETEMQFLVITHMTELAVGKVVQI